MAAMSYVRMPKSVPMEVKTSPNIKQRADVMRIDEQSSWIAPIISYIRDRILPQEISSSKHPSTH